MKTRIAKRTICGLLGLGTITAPAIARAQAAPDARGTVIAIGSVADERLRLRQLAGDTTLAGYSLRSVATLSPALAPDSASPFGIAWRLVLPQYRYVYNSALPYSLDDGALWAGRGSNAYLVGGVRAEWRRALHRWRMDSVGVRVFLLPELAASENRPFAPPQIDHRVVPPLPASRNAWSSPWHAGPQSIDLPWRMGDKPLGGVGPGQSSIAVDAGAVSVGVATENEWWGPGIRNALLLSNNARGFQHAFLRTSRPVRTRAGDFEARWLSGFTHESPFFDTDTTNDRNSISMAAVTWQPPGSTLVLGAARSVFAPLKKKPIRALEDAAMVFADVGQPNAVPASDSTMHPGRDQLLSLFFRWVEPRDRFEFYGEWARTEFPVSLRDWLVQPNHTQGYTLGLQWLGDTLRWDTRLRAQAEVTYLEQSTTYRQRPIGSWYTSRAVAQGYTNEGQVIGAAIGPGSSSQFVALDLVAPRWMAGAYLNRIRWMEDAHSQFVYNYDQDLHGMCEHDVSFLPGFRASADTRAGTVQADYSTGWRMNVFYQHTGGCFSTFPSGARDQRTNSLTISWSPRY